MDINLTELRKKLEENNFSFSTIALSLDLDKGTISKIFNDKYTGKDFTKQRVLQYCLELVQANPLDLSNDILNNSEMYERLMLAGSLLKAFKPEERKHFINMYETLKKYNETKRSNEQLAISNEQNDSSDN